jgi:hypothetical protein
MAFHGDLSSYPLPELLQWLDGSRKTGALHLAWEAGNRKLFLLGGVVVATATPGLWERLSRVIELGGEGVGSQVMQLMKTGQPAESVRLLAEDDLMSALVDLTQTQVGRFHWSEDPDRGEDEWVSVEMSLRHAVFESLRHLDELPDVERAIPSDTLVVAPTQGPLPTNVLQRVLYRIATAQPGMTSGRLWLVLGLSRTLVTRAIFDMIRAGQVVAEGAPTPEADPIADMLEKGAVLVRERQFDAAGLVFASLMQNDPSDRRVREFARMVEREHAASLYRELPPLGRFGVTAAPAVLAGLRPDERAIVAQLESGWDVSSVVLASGRRELDTLKSLEKLVRMGAIAAS